MNKKIGLLVLLVFGFMGAHAQVYKDPKAPVTLRVKDLLSRMTLEEKIMQMSASDLDKPVDGNMAYGVCASPFLSVTDIAKQSIAAKNQSRLNSRLGIPIIQIGECLHGQLAAGATIFPQAINQGSSWNPALIKQMGQVIAYEATSSGVDQALSPLFDIMRDPRYGRVEECYAEDPYLVSKLGVAFVTGMQGDTAQSKTGIGKDKIMCTAKHFAGYSFTTAGINLSPAEVGERELRSMILPSFQAAVQEANIYSVMPAYNEMDGIPAHANNFLLNQVLRKEWGFKGYVFSDYEGVKMLYGFQKVAKDATDAGAMALKAGVDLESPKPDAYPHLIELVKAGKIKMALIDTAV